MKLRNFKYKATNKEGKIITGKIEAINRDICKRYLETKNYKIIKIKEYRSIFSFINNITIGPLLKQKDLIFFLKQLGSLLKSGINILSALELLALQKDSKNLKKLYFGLYQDIYNGHSFSKALANKPKEFPKLLVKMIEVGEISGDLANMVMQMADYYEKQMEIARGIKGAIRMPLIYFIAAILVAIGMLLFVFPNITELFASFEGATLPPITQFFLNVGIFFENFIIHIVIILFLFILTFYLLNKYYYKFHHLLTKFILNAPLVGKLIRMHNQIMVANALSQMLDKGVNPQQALITIQGFLKNSVYKNVIKNTLAYIEDGKPFSKAFEESSYIDPIMTKMIATGEKTSNIPKLMKNLAKYYNGISDLRVEQLKNAIQPILLIFVYSIVGIMILAILLPMISLGGQI
ncbi:MAG: type II secretion system F family protein [Bacillota bacterium]